MGASNSRLSPRQKMINLMYIVLMAMLALNVSSDVLDGFTQVKDGLVRTNDNIEQRNASIIGALEAFSLQNPEKGLSWFKKGLEVRQKTTEIYNLVDSLKVQIVKKVDGPQGDINNIENREDLDAAAAIMLQPSTKRGAALRQSIEGYRNFITEFITDSVKSASILKALSTESVQRKGEIGEMKWEEHKFENQPVVAAITLLTKLQNDIKYCEGEALQSLLANVDAGDVRVNELNAFVIPDSRFVIRGSKYHANIVLAAVDTTQRPLIYINGKPLSSEHGIYEAPATSAGNYEYKGYLEVPHGDGTITRHDFASSYTVIEPTATISATMMNVLYAGIDNPISISVPGVANSGVSATMSNGTLSRRGDAWVAKPSKVGEPAIITVVAEMNGKRSEVSRTEFRVRKLPDPTPFVTYKDAEGNSLKYRGGGRGISKAQLMLVGTLEAAIDDDLLNITFNVLSFETVTFDSMGNAIPEVSDGNKFSSRQKAQLQRLKRGNRIYVTRVKAIGPDGITRELAPLEVIIN